MWRATESAIARSANARPATPASSRRARSCQCRDSRSPRRRSWRQKTWIAVAFLPEGPLGQHDRRTRRGKRQIGQMRRCVANDGMNCVRFARGARAELDHDLGAHQPSLLEQRLVGDVKAVPVDTKCCYETGAREPGLDDRVRLIPNPLGQAGADRPRPTLLLAPGRGKRLVAGAGNQVRREGADVVGDVDIFGETPDRAPYLGQRSAALEGQVLGERAIEEDTERRDDPDVLLQKVRLVVAATLRHLQSVAPVVGRKVLIPRLSHARGGRSPVAPSSSAWWLARPTVRRGPRREAWAGPLPARPRPLPDRAMPGRG